VLRTVIADDEAGARAHLRALLEVCHVQIVGECATGVDVLAMADSVRPDLVCLDIRMPDLDGLETARRLGSHPAVVFTTGFADFAASAFDLGAFDYLLKPLSLARVAEAVRRVRARLGSSAAHEDDRRRVFRLFIPADDQRVAVAPNAIRFIEARDGITIVHTDTGSYRLRTPLARLERELVPCGFLRTHRAYLVNLNRVHALVPWSRHVHTVLLEGGEETHVPVAKSRLAAFRGSVIWIPQAGGQRSGPGTARQGGDRGRCQPGIGPGDRRRPGG
jgi:DNA-binding LytR/AlgR family response regulator